MVSRLGVAGMLLAAVAAPVPSAQAHGDDDFEIVTLSNRADLVSGGDALIEVRLPRGVSLSKVELRLNGELMQRSSTADLVHSIPALVTYLTSLMTLEPGDVVATGTPAGVGSLRDPKVWLGPGDDIAISSPQLGLLETRIG